MGGGRFGRSSSGSLGSRSGVGALRTRVEEDGAEQKESKNACVMRGRLGKQHGKAERRLVRSRRVKANLRRRPRRLRAKATRIRDGGKDLPRPVDLTERGAPLRRREDRPLALPDIRADAHRRGRVLRDLYGREGSRGRSFFRRSWRRRLRRYPGVSPLLGLEARVDVVLHRAGLANSVRAGRQRVKHGWIRRKVPGAEVRRVTRPGKRVCPGRRLRVDPVPWNKELAGRAGAQWARWPEDGRGVSGQEGRSRGGVRGRGGRGRGGFVGGRGRREGARIGQRSPRPWLEVDWVSGSVVRVDNPLATNVRLPQGRYVPREVLRVR